MRPSNLVLAGHSLSLECADEAVAAYIERELEPFFGGDGADMKLSVALRWVEASGLTREGDGQFDVTLPDGSAVRLTQESAAGDVRLSVTAQLPAGGGRQDLRFFYDFLINHVFALTIQRLQAEGRAHIFMVHACGAVHAGRGFLFAGPSGVGKSTIARSLAAAGKRLLGDDMILVSRDDGAWWAHGSPMGGDLSRASLVNDSVPLEAIFLLAQEEQTAWHGVSSAFAATALIGLVVPSYPLSETAPQKLIDYHPGTTELLFDEAVSLAAGVPCFHLGLSLGDQPWADIFQAAATREADGSD